MGFLSPLFMFGTAAIAIPIALHFIKRQTEAHVKFSAVSMLKHAPVEASRHRHLREFLLLAVRISALLLLAVAFARPFFKSVNAVGLRSLTVVALDTSLSLSAPGQFDRARMLSRAAIDRAPAGDAVGVVTFANEAQVAAPPGDRLAAQSAVQQAAPTEGSTNYRAALSAVSDMVDALGVSRATLVLVTDLQATGWAAGDRGSLPDNVHVEIADVGTLPANLAVTDAIVARGAIVATVRNTDSRPRQAVVHLQVDGRKVGEAAVSVGPQESSTVALPGAQGVIAAVSVDDPTGIQADNVRYVVLENAGGTPVLVITGTGDLAREAVYTEQALIAAGRDGAAYRVEGIAASALGSAGRSRLDAAAAVILLSTRGLDEHGRNALSEYLEKGGGLLVAASDDIDPQAIGELFGRASFRLSVPPETVPGSAATRSQTFAPADRRHPLFQDFGAQASSLGLVKIRRAAKMDGVGCQTIAALSGGDAAVLDCTIGRGRALIFASDVNNRWNDFPLHATFVPFVHEAVKYLYAGRQHQAEYLVGEGPAGVPNKPGIAAVADPAGGGIRTVAVNVDPAESDPRRLTVDEFQSAIGRLHGIARRDAPIDAEQKEDHQRLWQYVLMAAALVLVGESFLARRTA